ncbi:SIS domain-containing protein [Micromonospora sp. ALFpr18c]|uniref:SIS domain-containing protein n=1 Tax=Micromonospora sp. ALFpr18c TaxID=1458665 RepID=UPI00124BC325|nr:SIS domain-containing protein [Micromonospora sp. ALFpr18c]KAB1935295.1 SIS domain-containing protein [Micromonospora sp. ALFpr18c]
MTTAAFDQHVAEQPDAVSSVLTAVPVPRLDPARPVLFTGIGSSLHACRVAAEWVRELSGGRVHTAALDAHDLALTGVLAPGDQVVVVSHRGTKAYPNEVLRRAADVGAYTVAITGAGPAEPPADVVLRTCPQERASTHTVSYVTALAVLACLVGELLGDEAAPLTEALPGVPDALRRTLELPIADAAVDALASSGPDPALLTGTGVDAMTAQEAALKIKEGTYRWAEGMHTEFALHGTPAVFRSSTVAYLIRPARPDGDRTDALRQLLTSLGSRTFVCAAEDDADLPFAAVHPLLRPLVAVVPFHRLVSLAAQRLGASPDLTHLEEEPWNSAIRAVKL